MQPLPHNYAQSNTLLLRGLRGRSEVELRAGLTAQCPSAVSALQLLRVITRCDVALLVFAHAHHARAVKESWEEDLVYTKPVDEETLQHHILTVPQLERNFLLSPPPSPPQDWQPIEEDINHVPHLDLQPQRIDGKTVLLEGSATTPSIIGDW